MRKYTGLKTFFDRALVLLIPPRNGIGISNTNRSAKVNGLNFWTAANKIVPQVIIKLLKNIKLHVPSMVQIVSGPLSATGS